MLVGFAAETGRLVPEAERKLRAKRLDLIVANDVSRPGVGFGSDFNEAFLIDRHGARERVLRMTKGKLARLIVRRCLEMRAKLEKQEGRGSGAGGRTRTGTATHVASGF